MPRAKNVEFDWSKLVPFKTESDARRLWPTEVDHLTPWVVENLDRISQLVGLQLDPTTVHREVPVGQLRADITVQDDHARTVIIETQFGPSDHDHFAKVVTYACAAAATAVIWIVAGTGGRFRPRPIRKEHQVALSKLNSVFNGETAFYGVSIELVSEPCEQRGVDYPCLPRLALVVKP